MNVMECSRDEECFGIELNYSLVVWLVCRV